MAIDKIFISHVVSELLIICGVSFYFHKKCSNLQQQVNELNSKLEKLNVNNYILSLKKQEQFEIQTVQQINKIYSMLNTIMNNQSYMDSNNPRSNVFNPVYNVENNTSTIKENYSPPQQSTTQQSQTPVKKNNQNPLLNTLSMIGPLSTMFQVMVDKKPPHPDELFQNIDINKMSGKIVEIEEEDNINTEELDNELEDELNDLKSNITTTLNTPITTPRMTPSHSSLMNDCENGMCKLNLNSTNENDTNNSTNNDVNNTNDNQIKNESSNDQSSPLRYISQLPEGKRGRPKKT